MWCAVVCLPDMTLHTNMTQCDKCVYLIWCCTPTWGSVTSVFTWYDAVWRCVYLIWRWTPTWRSLTGVFTWYDAEHLHDAVWQVCLPDMTLCEGVFTWYDAAHLHDAVWQVCLPDMTLNTYMTQCDRCVYLIWRCSLWAVESTNEAFAWTALQASLL